MIISRKKYYFNIFLNIYYFLNFLPHFQINYSFTHRFRYSVSAFEDYKHIATREVEILMPSYSPPNNEKKSHFP